METLFPFAVAVPDIAGLRYIPDYITPADEQNLVRSIDALPWDTKWQRRRQPYDAGYGSKADSPSIPDWGRQLADRMFAEAITPVRFDQMLVNEYEPGQGISSHRDYSPFGSVVVSLSLLSPCMMEFRQPSTGQKEQLLLEPRSLLILAEETRGSIGNTGSRHARKTCGTVQPSRVADACR